MKPALTKKEWAEALGGKVGADPPGYLMGTERITDERCHAMAACCLHGQEYGFTREDVKRHRNRAAYYRNWYQVAQPAGWDCTQEEMDLRKAHGEWHDSMADRIEALLPPEEK